ncbi:MAG: hypothetical protein M3Q14_03665 [bacterium]|nr:hypothetical protein [bacterium]
MYIIKNHKKIIIRPTLLVFAVVLMISTLISFAFNKQRTDALSGSDFNPGRIIDDSVFYNSTTMSAAQIQAFLNSKVPVCDTNHSKSSSSNDSGPPYTCLKDYRQNTSNIAPESGICNGYTGANNETSSTIIYKVAKSCGINPQVLLVMLQKEQSLVTDDWPWDIQYRKAMGAFCPDTAPCDPAYAGFFYQVYYGAHRFKVYKANPNSYNYKAGRNNSILWNPDTTCGRSTVYIQNQATASLYIYTPYRPNQAALNDLYGNGDLANPAPPNCSAFGNRNFWRMFNDWFGPTTGTPFFRISGSSRIYIQGAGNSYYYVSSPSMMESYGYGRTINKVDTLSASYLNGKTFKGNLPHVARFEGDEVFIVNEGRLHHLPNIQMLTNYGLTLGDEATLPVGIRYYYPQVESVSEILTISNGSGIYLVEGGEKRHIIGPSVFNTVGNPIYSTRPTVSLNSYFVNTLPFGGPVMKDGSYVKSIDTGKSWVWQDNSLHPISNEVASTWNLAATYSAPEIILTKLPTSVSTYGVYAQSEGGQKFILDNKKRLSLTAEDITKLNLMGQSFQTVPDTLLNLFSSKPFSSLSLVREYDKDPVFVIDDGVLFHVYAREEINHFNLNMGSVDSISGQTLQLFTNQGNVLLKGGRLIRNGNNPEVYMTDTDTTLRYVSSRSLLENYGFLMSDVISISQFGFDQYDIDTPLQELVHYLDDSYWLVDKRKRMKISPVLFSAYKFGTGSFEDISSAAIKRLETAKALTDLLNSPDGRVYKIEGGRKRWFVSRQVFERRRSWVDVRNVSEAFIDNYPDGPHIY